MISSRGAEIERARELLWGSVSDTVHDDAGRTGRHELSTLRLLQQAGFNRAAGAKILLRFGAAAFLACWAALITGKALLLVVIAVYGCLEWLGLQRAVWRRSEAFERDYVPFLLSLASGVRTGLDPLVAIRECAALFPQKSELRRQVEDLCDVIARGAEEEKAIRGFAGSIAHPDIQLFRTTLILARKEGSSLGESLQRLARVTRQRQSFRRKMRAALAMQRLSAIGIGGCAVVIGLIQTAGNADVLVNAFNHPLGYRALSAGLTLMGFGLLWMVQMSKRRV